VGKRGLRGQCKGLGRRNEGQCKELGGEVLGDNVKSGARNEGQCKGRG
jgi:hypothetical protein